MYVFEDFMGGFKELNPTVHKKKAIFYGIKKPAIFNQVKECRLNE